MMPAINHLADDRQRAPAMLLERSVALVTVVVPVVGAAAAAVLAWSAGMIRLVDLWLCALMYLASALGITAGFHRLFTHRAFEVGRPLQIILGVLGSMAAQGPLIFWVAMHRKHHQLSDSAGDPHSPRPAGPGAAAALRGLWSAHVGWMFAHRPESWMRYAPDLLKSRTAWWINRRYATWVVAGLAAPAIAGGILTRSWSGAGSALLWGGLVRIALVHHATWSVNSLCHAFGARPYETKDLSTNNAVCAALTLGEGWHNNHHAFPTSARHGLEWWQIDVTYCFIRALEILGAARAVKVPSRRQIEERQRLLVKRGERAS